MARRLRIQFPGAIYHVINRGNYRQSGKKGQTIMFDSAEKPLVLYQPNDDTSRHAWRGERVTADVGVEQGSAEAVYRFIVR